MTHYLSANEGERIPTSVAFVDVATLPKQLDQAGRKHLRIFHAAHLRWGRLEKGRLTRTGSLDCRAPDQLWSEIERRLCRRRVLWLFAYQLGRVITASEWWERKERRLYTLTDPHHRPRVLRDGSTTQARTSLIVTNDPPNVLEAWHTPSGGLMRCLDTLNYVDADMGQLAAWTGLVVPMEPAIAGTMVDWFQWAAARSAVVQAVALKLISWCRSEKMGNFRPTIASMAHASWRHAFLPPNLVVHTEIEPKQFERLALMPARQRPLWIGRICEPGRDWWDPDPRKWPPGLRPGPVHCYDVRSCYPAVMAHGLYPRERIRTDDGLPVPELAHRLRSLGAVAEVEVDGRDRPWPYRREGKGRVYWCVGRFWCVLCGDELREAVAGGWVRAAGKVQWYSLADLFSPWVKHWWIRRQKAKADGDTVQEALIKWLLNSLHGKLGARTYKWQTLAGQGASRPWGSYPVLVPGQDRPIDHRAVGWELQRSLPPAETEGGLPSVTAFVHSAARAAMHRLIWRVGEIHVLWENADSILVDEAGKRTLEAIPGMIGPTLGQLRHEWSAETGEIRGLNDYTLDGKTAIPGMAKTAVVTASGWDQDEWQHVDSTINVNKPLAGVIVRRELHTRPAACVPGKVDSQGRVRPWLPEEVPHES